MAAVELLVVGVVTGVSPAEFAECAVAPVVPVVRGIEQEDAAVHERLANEFPGSVGGVTTNVNVSTANNLDAAHTGLERARTDCVVVPAEITGAEGALVRLETLY